MISPYVLKDKYKGEIQIHKMVQYPGEFIITMSGAYHTGFNWGFNIAEAVNFGSLAWLRQFPQAKACKCVKDSVVIDKESFCETLLNSQYRNEPEVTLFKEYLARKREQLSA